MRRLSSLVCVAMVAALGMATVAVPAIRAEETPKDIKGLYLLTDYPAVTVRPGTTSTVSLRLQNYNLPPERLELSVSGVPSGWTATMLGGGQPVAAAMAATNNSASLQLRVDVPANAPMGTQTLTIDAKGGSTNVSLPIAVTLAKDLPAKLTVTPQLPELRGNARSNFEFQIGVKNDSGKRLVVALAADAPRNFEVSFTEQYGSQELNAVPIDAGQSKDVKLKVRPPNTIGAGRYPVAMRATAEDANVKTDVFLEITGQPKLDITGRDGSLSARATAGEETTIPVVITNSGTSPADQIELAGTAPTGWKITFEPKEIDRIAPGQNREVQAQITPATKAIAGDYQTSLRSTSRGESASSTFRITVVTDTKWWIVGIGIIGLALLVMVAAVARFGRR
jgi:uncharacterized membrane protein